MNPFALIYSIEFVLLVVCMAIYYKAAEMEHEPALLWMGISVAVYVFTWRHLRWSWFGCLLGQFALASGIAVVRAINEMRKTRQ